MRLPGLLAVAAMLGAVSTMSCSDPVGPEPRGSAYLEVGQANPLVSGKNCPHTSSGIIMGYSAPSTTSSGSVLVNDEKGATVECSVSGGNFSGKLKAGNGYFIVSGTSDGAKGTAQVTVWDPNALETLVSPLDTPCEVSASPPLGIGGEKAWATFTCKAMVASPPNLLCAVTDGVFYFDHCD